MKHLEFFKNGFDDTIDEKTQPENYPYVGYDIVTGEIVYTLVPEPVTVPADNEIWYTSSDEQVVTPNNTDAFGASIVSNEYNDVKGVITFDDSVTSIGYSAFSLSYITSIVIPDSVTSIGEYAFPDCFDLTSIVIPDSVTSIGEGAFENCFSLSSIVIPNSVTEIGELAFNCCSGMNSIIFEGTMEEWNSITKGSDWNAQVPATYVQCTDGQVTL